MHCTLCEENKQQEIWRDDLLYVINVDHHTIPCYFRVITWKHVKELTDLTPQERMHMWRVIEVVEECVREYCEPDKINLASLGNQVPHLHWHVIGRWKTDPYFPETIWSTRVRCNVYPETLELRRQKAREAAAEITRRLNAIKDTL